jgi:hypothetical protein
MEALTASNVPSKEILLSNDGKAKVEERRNLKEDVIDEVPQRNTRLENLIKEPAALLRMRTFGQGRAGKHHEEVRRRSSGQRPKP